MKSINYIRLIDTGTVNVAGLSRTMRFLGLY